MEWRKKIYINIYEYGIYKINAHIHINYDLLNEPSMSKRQIYINIH